MATDPNIYKAGTLGSQYQRDFAGELIPTIGSIAGSYIGTAAGIPLAPATLGASIPALGITGSGLGTAAGEFLQQGIEKIGGVRDEYDPAQITAAGLQGATIEGLFRGGGKLGSVAMKKFSPTLFRFFTDVGGFPKEIVDDALKPGGSAGLKEGGKSLYHMVQTTSKKLADKAVTTAAEHAKAVKGLTKGVGKIGVVDDMAIAANKLKEAGKSFKDFMNMQVAIPGLNRTWKVNGNISPGNISFFSKLQAEIADDGAVSLAGALPKGQKGFLYYAAMADDFDGIMQGGLTPGKTTGLLAETPEQARKLAMDLYAKTAGLPVDDVAILQVSVPTAAQLKGVWDGATKLSVTAAPAAYAKVKGKVAGFLSKNNIGVGKDGALAFNRPVNPDEIAQAVAQTSIKDAWANVLKLGANPTIMNIDSVLKRIIRIGTLRSGAGPLDPTTKAIIKEMSEQVLQFADDLGKTSPLYAQYAKLARENTVKRWMLSEAQSVFKGVTHLKTTDSRKIMETLMNMFQEAGYGTKKLVGEVDELLGTQNVGTAAGTVLKDILERQPSTTISPLRTAGVPGILTRTFEAIPRKAVAGYVATGRFMTPEYMPIINVAAKTLGIGTDAVLRLLGQLYLDKTKN